MPKEIRQGCRLGCLTVLTSLCAICLLDPGCSSGTSIMDKLIKLYYCVSVSQDSWRGFGLAVHFTSILSKNLVADRMGCFPSSV